MGTLSQYLRQTIRELNDYIKSEPPEEQKEAAEAKWVVGKITAYLLESVEGFSDKTTNDLEAFLRAELPRGFREYIFDEYYTRNLLKRVPKMVARTLKLSRLVPRKMPSPATNVYLREATRSYVFGFWQGSVALSRAALEAGLREQVKDKLGTGRA